MLSEHTPYFPMFVNLLNKKIFVFGGGVIAQRRILTLLDFGCTITVIAPQITTEIEKLTKQKKLKILTETYKKGDCKNADIVLAATNDRNVNREIFIECNNENIPVNVADCKEECSFYFPAIVKDSSLVIGVTASGSDHRLVKDTAEKIRKGIFDNIEYKERKSRLASNDCHMH